jgi:hypothetical protein
MREEEFGRDRLKECNCGDRDWRQFGEYLHVLSETICTYCAVSAGSCRLLLVSASTASYGGSCRFRRNGGDLFVRHIMEQPILCAKRREHHYLISRITQLLNMGCHVK